MLLILDRNKNSEINKNVSKNENLGDYSNNLSKIEFKNQSFNSSLRSLSRGEDYIQKDFLQVLNCQPTVSHKYYKYLFISLIYFFSYRKKIQTTEVLLKTIMIIIKSQNYPWKTHFKVKEVKILF